MSSGYEIKQAICDLCPNTTHDLVTEARKDFPDLFDGQLWTKEKMETAWFKKRNEEYAKKIDEIYKARPVKKCFHFIADCGGDEIAICRECFAGILQELDGE